MKLALSYTLCLVYGTVCCVAQSNSVVKPVWVSDHGDGIYTNPVIFADYSDPDVIRVGDDLYLTASSFSSMPGLPILHSKDLVNWTIIGHAFENYPFEEFTTPQPGCGVWAPSIRYHDGEFYIYFGDPDNGIFMTKAKSATGPWTPLWCVKQSKGWIDPCPFWDDNGKAYLIHAWAKSRSGINSILTINQMSADGMKLLDDGRMVVDGRNGKYPTLEGPKLYKRNGYYYIFAPAGGVAAGYQLVFRSKQIYSLYEGHNVMDQGSTPINGPHQGAWVELPSGESWFIHFQDRGAYGRITHLQPMKWVDDWPIIGNDPDGTGRGQPVLAHKKPDVGKVYPVTVPQTSDEFDSTTLGTQWQWAANFHHEWYSLSARPGWLRLFAVSKPNGAKNLLGVPNVILQKLPAPEFTVTTKFDLGHLAAGENTGLVVLGGNYSFAAIDRTSAGSRLIRISNGSTIEDTPEGGVPWTNASVFLRVRVGLGASCEFSYSNDGKQFSALGKSFHAQPGGWAGARVGLFCLAPADSKKTGYVDVDWFRLEQ
jgi:beta-xylosidase